MADGPTMEPKTQRSMTEAIDECVRELNVRKRCFPRWIEIGRVSRTDAQDRIDRLASAIDLLNAISDKAAVEIHQAALDKAAA